MSRLFEPKTKKEFFESVDRSLNQAKSGQRLDALEAAKNMTKIRKAGYHAMNAIQAAKTGRAVARS